METPTFYAILPASVRYDARLKAAEKILYCEITSLSNAKKYCHAGNNYFATLYDVDERTIRRWLHNLEELGYLLIEYEKQGDGQQRRIIPLDNAPAGVPEMSAPDKIVRPTRTEMSAPDKIVRQNITRIIIQERITRARARA